MIARKWALVFLAAPAASQGEIWESSHAGVYDGFAPALVELASDLLQNLIHESAKKKNRFRDANDGPDELKSSDLNVAPLTIPNARNSEEQNVSSGTSFRPGVHGPDIAGIAEVAPLEITFIEAAPLAALAFNVDQKLNVDEVAEQILRPQQLNQIQAAVDSNTAHIEVIDSSGGVRGVQEDIVDVEDEDADTTGPTLSSKVWKFFQRLLFWL